MASHYLIKTLCYALLIKLPSVYENVEYDGFKYYKQLIYKEDTNVGKININTSYKHLTLTRNTGTVND